MRAVVLRDHQMVLRDDVPEPVPGVGQVLVSVTACGICGSDLHFAKHGDKLLELGEQLQGAASGGQKLDLSGDVFMGHEFSAEVLEAGPDTDAPKAGAIVTSLPVLLSATGFDPIFTSNTTIGGYAERMLLSAPLLLPVPNGLDPRHAALTELEQLVAVFGEMQVRAADPACLNADENLAGIWYRLRHVVAQHHSSVAQHRGAHQLCSRSLSSSVCSEIALTIASPARPSSWSRMPLAQSCDARGAAS